MWDVLIDVIAVMLAGQVVSKYLTGKWLHEHVYEWWRELSEQIADWVKEHETLGIARVIGFVNRKLDHVVVSANRAVKLAFFAQDSQQRRHAVIEEVELSAEEVAAQFPELLESRETLVLELSYSDSAPDPVPVDEGYGEQPNETIDSQFQGVLAIYNNRPSAGECAYKLRWRLADGNWTDWKDARLKAAGAWYWWMPGAQVCQMDFDSVGGDRFWTSKIYDLALNCIPAEQTASIEDGRPYHFEWSGNNVELIQGK